MSSLASKKGLRALLPTEATASEPRLAPVVHTTKPNIFSDKSMLLLLQDQCQLQRLQLSMLQTSNITRKHLKHGIPKTEILLHKTTPVLHCGEQSQHAFKCLSYSPDINRGDYMKYKIQRNNALTIPKEFLPVHTLTKPCQIS